MIHTGRIRKFRFIEFNWIFQKGIVFTQFLLLTLKLVKVVKNLNRMFDDNLMTILSFATGTAFSWLFCNDSNSTSSFQTSFYFIWRWVRIQGWSHHQTTSSNGLWARGLGTEGWRGGNNTFNLESLFSYSWCLGQTWTFRSSVLWWRGTGRALEANEARLASLLSSSDLRQVYLCLAFKEKCGKI